MKVQIGDHIEQYQEEMLADLRALIAIRSVASEPTASGPFGDGPARALQYMLGRARDFGLDVVNVDHYAGHAQITGGPEVAGILVHLDTVPEGEGWSTDPYTLTIKQGMLYGRGVSDNKAPAICALYALRALKEAHVPLTRTLRVIFGTAEETTQQDMAYYFARYPVPDLAFTPDVGPAIFYAEMGIFTLQFVKLHEEGDVSPILSLEAGQAANMVPDRCTCRLRIAEVAPDIQKSLKQKMKAGGHESSLSEQADVLTIVTHGKSAHGSVPQFGVNAIIQMVEVLQDIWDNPVYANSPLHQTLRFIHTCIGEDFTGQGLGIACHDKVTGALVVNMGMLRVDEQSCRITLNIRHPATVDSSFVRQGLEHTAETFHFQMAHVHYMPPVYVPTNHPLIAKLSRAHEAIMGEKPDLVTTAGGTYAKWLQNQGVGYGGVWKEGYAHQADERIRIDEWMKLARLITQAAYELSQL